VRIQLRWSKVRGVFAAAWQVVRIAVSRFTRLRAAESAAGMAFYALFALFPLLLFLIAAGSAFLQSEAVRQEVVDLVTALFPSASDIVVRNLQEVLALRGPASIVATLSLLWSASGFFGILSLQINRVWPGSPPRLGWQGRLIGLAMVALLALLLILWMFMSTIFQLLFRFTLPILGQVDVSVTLRRLVSVLVSWVLPLAFTFVLYRLVPRRRPRTLSALTGAVMATLAWNLATAGFTYYLSSGLARYQIVYGSLASVVVLIFWIYLSNAIILLGAHVSAATQWVWRTSGRRVETPPE
jgi:membrane protein